MSDLILPAIVATYAGWLGYRLGVKDGVKSVAGMINPSHLKFALSLIEGARKVRDARRFSGPGVHIHNEGDWNIEGIGRFKITIEEKEAVDA